MASRLKNLIKAFGVKDGLKFYAHIKVNPSGHFYSSRYHREFYLRPGTSDYYTFDQVFIEDQYAFDIPFRPSAIIDAGANIGLSSVYFAHRFPEAKIIAIEPSRENCAVLERNIAGLENVYPLCMGLWNKDTCLEIIDRKTSKNSFMVREVDSGAADCIPAISVPTIMERFKLDIIDILKIDIEGSEKELFEENYASWLGRTRMLIIEIHDFMKDGCANSVFRALSGYDFSFSMKHENIILINRNAVKAGG